MPAVLAQPSLDRQRDGQRRVVHAGDGVVAKIADVLRQRQHDQRIVRIAQPGRGAA